MNMRTNIDLLDQKVLNNLDTGEVVIYRSGTGVEVTVRSIFDNGFELVGLGESGGVVSSGPAAFVLLADLSSDPEQDEGARLIVDEIEYDFSEPQKDGKGGVLLQLHATVTALFTELGFNLTTEDGLTLTTETL